VRKPRLLSEKCGTCIFRAGNPMHLAEGRFREVVQGNRDAGTVLTCHSTLPYGPYPDAGEAMCRGYWDAYAEDTNLVRVMDRLAGGRTWYEEVPPPGPDTTP